MTTRTSQALLRRLVGEFERRRWRGNEQAALSIVRAMEDEGTTNFAKLAKIPGSAFLAKNRITRKDVMEACNTALSGQKLSLPSPPLISIDEIDTFRTASRVASHDVAGMAREGLSLPERIVKQYIAQIVGEPYLDRDWGGELGDIYTSRVNLKDRRIRAAFLLKGNGTHGKLTPKKLGSNGDQIRRMSKQHAELYVVQHVGQIDEAVHDQLRDMVLARRSEGHERAVGSVWDGADCARLFIANRLIDRMSGTPIS